MAKVCSVIVGLCCLFSCLILVCNSSDTKSIGYDTYHVVSNLESLEPYSVLIRRKRQTPTSIENASPQKSADLSKSNESQSTTASNSTDSTSQNPKTDLSNASVSTTKSTLQLDQQRLLGVNGTGQRKTGMKFTVSDPISSDSNSTNVLKPIKLSPVDGVEQDDDDDESIIDDIDVSNEETEKLAKEHNITEFKEEYFVFYNSTKVVDPERVSGYWDSVKNLTVNAMLSKSHRRAITVQLKFDFPFYGHPVRNVTVATGGFLYTGEYVHSWLAATQYIAPLMANFDTSISNSSFVRFDDNGTAFTVLWENVSLQDKHDVGQFTFSVTLHESGDIVFAYYSLPMMIHSIQDDKHPVKIGLSDAYIIDKTIFFARRKTIYEYHRVNFDGDDISNNTIITLTANPTCHNLTDCEKCVNFDSHSTFKCNWCPALNKCSTGTDRKRQEWLHKGCDRTQITDAASCPALGAQGNNYGAVQDVKDVTGSGERYLTGETPVPNVRDTKDNDVHISNAEPLADESAGVSMALGLFVPIILVMTLVLWVFYAYRNPHTKSGQLLIQYRPSQWSWRRGEARYTAATIHM
ncbi:plexin domain-containing protein 2 isoform X2 [Bradysia coprophila]|uniref:plexin domain-containing protein 2 isoform X2 n=1 Tax=Bradysia coprophila TaxID=38358 RepID=UPI00187DA3BE|nr:plexin domain-containing protein 2 isoform X2 [Bradysia coprophila]